LMPWLLKWLKASRPANVRMISRAMHAMHATTFEHYQPQLKEIGEPDLIRRTGQLYVSKNDQGFGESGLARELREEAGVKSEPVHGNEIHEIEPALSSEYRSGLFLPGNGACANPYRLVQVLA